MQAKRGFTLVEILIVVVILGILAAIVIPQFTQASTEAKLNSLCSNLQTLRSQIELYKVQHNDVPPGNTVAANGVITESVGSFADQMMYCTQLDGADNDVKERDSTFKFGPYLERIPDNPFSGENGVAEASGAGIGWVYDPNTGEVHAAADSTAETAAHEAL